MEKNQILYKQNVISMGVCTQMCVREILETKGPNFSFLKGPRFYKVRTGTFK